MEEREALLMPKDDFLQLPLYCQLKREMKSNKNFLQIAHTNVNGIMTLKKMQELYLLTLQTGIDCSVSCIIYQNS